ncbi:hypothetical protein [Lentzea sp. NPDC004782]|uniref:hypothetical protein n=1 Tax=Lentzea sp. NPDC004782 TaxID=3154458 RepID=UPI0033B1905C
MRKLVLGAALGLGLLAASAVPALAGDWYYTGHWYDSAGACEEGYQQMVPPGSGGDLPHECRYNAGGNVYELWRVAP